MAAWALLGHSLHRYLVAVALCAVVWIVSSPQKWPQRETWAPVNNTLDTIHIFVAFVNAQPAWLPNLTRLLDDIYRATHPQAIAFHVLTDESLLVPSSWLMQGLEDTDHVAWYGYEGVVQQVPRLQELCRGFKVSITSPTCVYLTKVLLHEILPVSAVLALDMDIRVVGNLTELWNMLPDMRRTGALVGMAYEQQPTYMLRRTRWGRLQGFNGGVQLHDLDGQRRQHGQWSSLISDLHNSDGWRLYGGYLNLGDQTLFTMWNYSHPNLFYKLHCGWNRQLCALYFNPVKIAKSGYRYKARLWEIEFLPAYLCSASQVHIWHNNCAQVRPSDFLDGPVDVAHSRLARQYPENAAPGRWDSDFATPAPTSRLPLVLGVAALCLGPISLCLALFRKLRRPV